MTTLRELKIGDEEKLIPLFKILTGKEVLIDTVALVADPDCVCLVFENDDELVGFGSLIIHKVPSIGEVARIEDLVVDEMYQNRGFGKKIMQTLINTAKEKNISYINLRSNPSREHAIALYESLGFVYVKTNSYYLRLK